MTSLPLNLGPPSMADIERADALIAAMHLNSGDVERWSLLMNWMERRIKLQRRSHGGEA